jgi:hypothetical protein
MADELIHFIETKIFTKRIDKLASLEVLFALQHELARDPELGDLIPGCGGARKGRIGDKGQGRGKSGAFRYIYIYIEVAGIIYLLYFYGKNEMDNLSKAERNEIAEIIAKLKSTHAKERRK